MVAYMWNTDRKAVIIRIIDALAVVKSMAGLSYRHLRGSEDAVTYQCARHKNAAAWIVPFKLKCAKHSFTEGSIHHRNYDEDVFTCIQDMPKDGNRRGNHVRHHNDMPAHVGQSGTELV